MKLVITLNEETHAMMSSAAEFAGLPISLWARAELLKVARATKHRILCTPKAQANDTGYQWCGKPCTKEELEAFEKQEAKTLANHNARQKEVDKMPLY